MHARLFRLQTERAQLSAIRARILRRLFRAQFGRRRTKNTRGSGRPIPVQPLRTRLTDTEPKTESSSGDLPVSTSELTLNSDPCDSDPGMTLGADDLEESGSTLTSPSTSSMCSEYPSSVGSESHKVKVNQGQKGQQVNARQRCFDQQTCVAPDTRGTCPP